MRGGCAIPLVHVWHDDPDAAVALAARLTRVHPGIHAIPVSRSVPRDAVVVIAAAPDRDDAAQIAHALRAQAPRAALVLALAKPDVRTATSVVAAGAVAVIDLDASDASLAHGLNAVLTDGAYVPRPLQAPVLAALAARRRDSARNRARIASLTSSERRVLQLLGTGADRAAVAESLHVPLHRVRATVDRARGKLGASTQRQAVALFRDDVTRDDLTRDDLTRRL